MECAFVPEDTRCVRGEVEVGDLLELQDFVEVVRAVAHREGVVLWLVLRVVIPDEHFVSLVDRYSVGSEVVMRNVCPECFGSIGLIEIQCCGKQVDRPGLRGWNRSSRQV